ncbi:energy transducer TonB [Flavobacterium pedocola]
MRNIFLVLLLVFVFGNSHSQNKKTANAAKTNTPLKVEKLKESNGADDFSTVVAEPSPEALALEKEKNKNTVYVAVEEQAMFEGGLPNFYRFFNATFKTPKVETSGLYKVMAGFIIEKDGTLSAIKILRSPGKDFDEAVIEALKKSPKWFPAMQNGEVVRSQFTLPIAINCEAEDPEPVNTQK